MNHRRERRSTTATRTNSSALLKFLALVILQQYPINATLAQ
jgi:hypothetical protein